MGCGASKEELNNTVALKIPIETDKINANDYNRIIPINEIFKGKLNNLPNSTPKIVSIFLSSTFSGILNYYLHVLLNYV